MTYRSLRPLALVLLALWFIGGCAGQQTVQTPHTHFYFVQMTDPHFGLPDTAERAARCVDEINTLPMPIECVVVTGDITMNDILDPNVTSEARSIIRKVKPPVYWLPGNHDIDPKNLAATVSAYKKNFGPLCSKAEYHGVVFLFVYTEPLKIGFNVEGLDVYKWAESEIIAAGRKPVIIFHHSPSVDDFYSGKFHTGWKADAQAKWHKLIESHKNIKAVIAGHFHRDELHWIGDTPLYICPPVASLFDMSVVSYRIYEYSDGKLGYHTEYPRPKK
jgi:Icc-related predicted phosphoesterase